MLVILSEVRGSLNVSDEWARHPETDEAFDREEFKQVFQAGRAWLEAFDAKIPRP